MSLISQSTLPQVAMEFMNTVHAEDVDIINNLYTLIESYNDEGNENCHEPLDKAYERWYEHTLDHFEGEEIKMQELNFPPYHMHKGEHEKALARMEEIYRSWKKRRDITILENYIGKEIPMWLNNHIQTMDTVTAMFFQ